jgi:hypothetical protein
MFHPKNRKGEKGVHSWMWPSGRSMSIAGTTWVQHVYGSAVNAHGQLQDSYWTSSQRIGQKRMNLNILKLFEFSCETPVLYPSCQKIHRSSSQEKRPPQVLNNIRITTVNCGRRGPSAKKMDHGRYMLQTKTNEVYGWGSCNFDACHGTRCVFLRWPVPCLIASGFLYPIGFPLVWVVFSYSPSF